MTSYWQHDLLWYRSKSRIPMCRFMLAAPMEGLMDFTRKLETRGSGQSETLAKGKSTGLSVIIPKTLLKKHQKEQNINMVSKNIKIYKNQNSQTVSTCVNPNFHVSNRCFFASGLPTIPPPRRRPNRGSPPRRWAPRWSPSDTGRNDKHYPGKRPQTVC